MKQLEHPVNHLFSSSNVSVVSSASSRLQKKKKGQGKHVLDEDAYVKALGDIIERDFYPDLPKLKQQIDWLEALETKDPILIAKARQRIDPSIRNSKTVFVSSASSTFADDTIKNREDQSSLISHDEPDDNKSIISQVSFADSSFPTSHSNDQLLSSVSSVGEGSISSSSRSDENAVEAERLARIAIANGVSIEQFLSMFTSSDNASFQKNYQSKLSQLKEKYDFLETKPLLLGDAQPSSSMVTALTTTNSLFFPPNDATNSSSSSTLKLENGPTSSLRPLKAESISRSKTRLSKTSLEDAMTTSTAQLMRGIQKSSLDKKKNPMEIPEVNGYTYVVPPVVEREPLASSNPFVIKPQSGREILALALQEQKSTQRKRERDNYADEMGAPLEQVGAGRNASILDTTGVVPAYAATASVFSTSQVGRRNNRSNASVASRASSVNSMQSKSSSLARLPPAAAALARRIAKEMNRSKTTSSSSVL
jgi:Nuclear protein Es2